MDIIELFKLIWSVLWLVISVGFFWVVGCAGYRYIYAPAELRFSRMIHTKKKRSELVFTLVTAVFLTSVTLRICDLRGISPVSVLRLLLPMEDIGSIFGLTGTTGSSMVSAMKHDPSNFLIDVFTTPESYCTLFGTAMLTALYHMVKQLLGVQPEKGTMMIQALNALCVYIVTICLTVIAYSLRIEIREVLIWVVTWGTGQLYFETSASLILKFLFALFTLVAGSVIFGLQMKEITGNSFFAVIFGSVFAQMIHTPQFTTDSRTGYIILALVMAFAIKWISVLLKRKFNRETDYAGFGEENLFAEYIYNGCTFLAGMATTTVLSLAYFHYLAS